PVQRDRALPVVCRYAHTSHATSAPALPACPLCIFFGDPPAAQIYPLSLHDALPILMPAAAVSLLAILTLTWVMPWYIFWVRVRIDRKSTRLNSSHDQISYAVFCLKKKKRGAIRHTEWHVRLPAETILTCAHARNGAT